MLTFFTKTYRCRQAWRWPGFQEASPQVYFYKICMIQIWDWTFKLWQIPSWTHELLVGFSSVFSLPEQQCQPTWTWFVQRDGWPVHVTVSSCSWSHCHLELGYINHTCIWQTFSAIQDKRAGCSDISTKHNSASAKRGDFWLLRSSQSSSRHNLCRRIANSVMQMSPSITLTNFAGKGPHERGLWPDL